MINNIDVDIANLILVIITSIILPTIWYLIQFGVAKFKYRKIKNMVKKEYLDPIKVILNNLEEYGEDKEYKVAKVNELLKDIKSIINKKVKSAEYTRDKEFNFYSSENQLEFIRMFNYVIDLYGYFIKLDRLYGYRSPEEEEGLSESEIRECDFKCGKLEYWNKNIYKDFDSYIKLGKNSLGGASLQEEFTTYMEKTK